MDYGIKKICVLLCNCCGRHGKPQRESQFIRPAHIREMVMRSSDAVLTENKSTAATVVRQSVTTFGFWKCETAAGTFVIRPHEGRWIAQLEDKWLGAYRTPREALNALVRDPAPLIDVLSHAFGIPADLSEWDFVRV